METTLTDNTYTIDATGKRLGKVATEAAAVLLGKLPLALQSTR